MKNMQQVKYAIITPAHNEVDYIENTIKSVIVQTLPPAIWVIVSDRSMDGTDDIVQSYAKKHSFIKYIRKNEDTGRNTASKVIAFNLGLSSIKNIHVDYICNLDADVTFDEYYFEKLLIKFDEDDSLGIGGGRIYQANKGTAYELKSSEESVAGAVQCFRRSCFEQIGGYLPLKGGFEDGVAEIMARYYGWRTQSFRDIPVLHHREIGTVGRNIWRARFNAGINEYIVGFCYSYHLLRGIYRLIEPPYVIGSLLVYLGYICGAINRKNKVLPDDMQGFIHREQQARLVRCFKSFLKRKLKYESQ